MKLTSSIIAFVFVSILAIVGVLAVPSTTILLGGGLTFEKENVEESILDYDSENNYYYLKMGTYNGNPVRWRYVSDVTNTAIEGGSSIGKAQRFVASAENKPNTTTGRQGMFILESELYTNEILSNNILPGIEDERMFSSEDGIREFLDYDKYSSSAPYYHTTSNYTTVKANDYSCSDVRAFLNGRNDVLGNSLGSLLEVIELEKTDSIYTKIEGRTLSDLYSDIGVIGDKSEVVNLPTLVDGTAINESQIDKFWIPSYMEVYTILGGNSQNNNEILWNGVIWDEILEDYSGVEADYHVSYHTRSPMPSNYGDSYCNQVYYSSSNGLGYLSNANYAYPTRPCFILNF